MCVCVWVCLWYGDGQACNSSETNQRGIQVTNRRTNWGLNAWNKIAHQHFSVVYAILRRVRVWPRRRQRPRSHGEYLFGRVWSADWNFVLFFFARVCAFSSLRHLTRHHVTAIPINRFVDKAKKNRKTTNIVRFGWKFYLWVRRDWIKRISKKRGNRP